MIEVHAGLRVVGLTGIRSISHPPLKVQKVGGLYRRGCTSSTGTRRGGGRGTGATGEGENEGGKGTYPACRGYGRHDIGNAAARRPFNVALTSASRCTWHHSPLGERRWKRQRRGGAILRTRPLVGPRNTVSRLGTHGRDIDGPTRANRR